MTLEEFSSLVRKKRYEIGLSQLELGRRVRKQGSDSSVQKLISNIETGVKVDEVLIKSVCRELGIRPVPKVEIPTNKSFRAHVRNFLNPVVSLDDLTMLCGNDVLRDIVDERVAEVIRFECENFRNMLATLKK